MVFEAFWFGENPPKFLFLNSRQRHDSITFHKEVTFSEFWAYFYPQNPDTAMPWSLRTPGKHRPIMVSQRKGGGHMEISPPGMIRNHGPHFD
jgi:hypothetical protein